jgi:hypothetical protein
MRPSFEAGRRHGAKFREQAGAGRQAEQQVDAQRDGESEHERKLVPRAAAEPT